MTNTLQILILAIAMVETGGDDRAVNKKEQAYGALQVRQCIIDDVNHTYGTQYKLVHMHWRHHAVNVFVKYTDMWDAYTAEEKARVWNGGPRGWKKGATWPYWLRVRNIMRKARGEVL